MKTAISLPDDIFQAADREAQRRGTSRSQLVAEALTEYLLRHAPDEVTEALNKALADLDDGKDPFVQRAAGKTLERTEW